MSPERRLRGGLLVPLLVAACGAPPPPSAPPRSTSDLDAEGAFWEGSSASEEGLERYLATYPEGRYVNLARVRLRGLRDPRSGESVCPHCELPPPRPSARERRWVERALEFYLGELLALGRAAFEEPFEALLDEHRRLGAVFRRAPAPVRSSDGRTLRKVYASAFRAPRRGRTAASRVVALVLRILLDDEGRARRYELLLPQRGFSRWREYVELAYVDDEDEGQRGAAVEAAVAGVVAMLGPHLDGATAVDVGPPVLAPVDGPGLPEGSEGAPGAPPAVRWGRRWPDGRELLLFEAAPQDAGPAADGLVLRRESGSNPQSG